MNTVNFSREKRFSATNEMLLLNVTEIKWTKCSIFIMEKNPKRLQAKAYVSANNKKKTIQTKPNEWKP